MPANLLRRSLAPLFLLCLGALPLPLAAAETPETDAAPTVTAYSGPDEYADELRTAVALVEADGEGALARFRLIAGRRDRTPGLSERDVRAGLPGDRDREIIVALEAAARLVDAAADYAGRALGNPEYDETHFDELAAEAAPISPGTGSVAREAAALIVAARERGDRLRDLREEVFEKMQDEARRGGLAPGTRLAWSIIRLGVGMPGARLDPDSFRFDRERAEIDLVSDGIPVRIALDSGDFRRSVRAEVDGYRFRTGWATLLQKPLNWMLAVARTMREAGLPPEQHAEWLVLEAPGGLVALAHPRADDAGANPLPEAAFFQGRLRNVEGIPLPAEAEAGNGRFLAAAKALHDGVMADDTIAYSLRQALHPVLQGTYQAVDPRDYFDSDFCRRLIEADYLEAHIVPLPPARAWELTEYREALARLEAGHDRFAVGMADGGRLVAVVKASLDPGENTGEVVLDPESGEAVPPYEWRLEEPDATVFHSVLPARYLYALSLSERYQGRHRIRPEGVPDEVEVWHPVVGRIGGYRSGAATADGDADAWLAAVTLDCRGRLDTSIGPLGWNFPFHILQRDGQGDPVRIATLNGVIESPDFSGISDAGLRRRDEDAWLDRAAALLRTPGELGLIFHHFFRYCSDSPLPELPNLIGSHYGLSDTHQTVYESLERRWVGRLIGDCDDLAEFFQVLTARQGKLSHVMQIPAHAAAGFVERTDDGQFRFVVLQTGPVMQFTAPTLWEVVEKAYLSFDSDRGASRITPAAVPILLRFADEETRTPFVLSARIYEDTEYAETMIRVQGHWHLNVFSAAIAEMEELIGAGDRETGNLKELASLYEQVGRYEDSAALRREELESAGGDAISTLSTLQDIAQLQFKDKDRPAALRTLTEMEKEIRRLHEEDPALFSRSLPFRSAWAGLMAKLDEPVRAWRVMANDVAEALGQGGRLPDYLVYALVAVHDRLALPADGDGKRRAEALREMEAVLDATFATGHFRRDDTYNRIMSRYYLLGRYAVACEGRGTGLRLLEWDGPYPEGPREHHQRRRPISGGDWEWFRIVPNLYLVMALEKLDRDDNPEFYDPEGAKPLLEGVARAVEKGRGLGSDVVGGETAVKAALVLSFLNNDLDAYRATMAKVRGKNYASLYDDAALAFGNYCGLVPAAEFPQWIEELHRFFPGRQHYFKAAYRALDKEFFAHALLLAEATARFFPDDALLTAEARYLGEAIPAVRADRESRQSR